MQPGPVMSSNRFSTICSAHWKPLWMTMSDPVSPKHYQGFSNGAQVIDITECLNFNRGNAVKYVARAGRKAYAQEIEDLHKARWYIDREIARVMSERNK